MSRSAKKLSEVLEAKVCGEMERDYSWLARSLGVSRAAVLRWRAREAVPVQHFLPLSRLLGQRPSDPEWRQTCGIPECARPQDSPGRDMISYIKGVQDYRDLVAARTAMECGAPLCANTFEYMRAGNALVVFTLNLEPLIFNLDHGWRLAEKAVDALRRGALIAVFAPSPRALSRINYGLHMRGLATPEIWRAGIRRLRRYARLKLTHEKVHADDIEDLLYQRLGVIETIRTQLYTPSHNPCLFAQYEPGRALKLYGAMRLPSGHLGGLLPYTEPSCFEETIRQTAHDMAVREEQQLEGRKGLLDKSAPRWASQLKRLNRRVQFTKHLAALLAENHSTMSEILRRDRRAA